MKRLTFAIISASLIALASCGNLSGGSGDGTETASTSASTGNLRVAVLGSFPARTILPASLVAAGYRLTGTGPAGASLGPIETASGDFSVTNLAPGSWTVRVEGLDGSGTTFLSGQKTVTVSAGVTASATVSLSPVLSGKGSLSVSLSWPAAHAVDEIRATLSPVGGPEGTVSFALSGASASLSLSDLDAGSYLLVATPWASGRKVGRPIVDSVVIFPNRQSSASIALADADFGQGQCVIYMANGASSGDVPVDVGFYAAGDGAAALGNSGALSLTGYFFAGWNTKDDGTGTPYAVSSTIPIGSSDVVLYALWAPKPAHRVYYDKNGCDNRAAPEDLNTYVEGATVYLPGDTDFTRGDFFFSGWSESSAGSGTVYGVSDAFPMPDHDVTLYAVWKRYLYVDATAPVVMPDAYSVTIYSWTDYPLLGITETFICRVNGVSDLPSWEISWYVDGALATGETASSFDYTPPSMGRHCVSAFIRSPEGYLLSATKAFWVKEYHEN